MEIDNIHLSKKIQELLETPKAKDFRFHAMLYCSLAYQSLSPRYPNWMSISRLDTQMTSLAVDSAFIDLERDEAFHDYDNGPAPEKVGAALAAWIARLRPIHQTEDLKDRCMIAFLNPLFALQVGWSYSEALKRTVPPHQARGTVEDVAEMVKLRWEEVRDIIYTLHWRNPNYRQMTLIFSLAKFLAS